MKASRGQREDRLSIGTRVPVATGARQYLCRVSSRKIRSNELTKLKSCNGSFQSNAFTKLDPGRKKGKLAMGAFEAMNCAAQISDDFLSYLGAVLSNRCHLTANSNLEVSAIINKLETSLWTIMKANWIGCSILEEILG